MRETATEPLSATDRRLFNATNLPPEYYYRQDIFDLEVDRIFRKEWIYVGRVEDIPNVGDYFRAEVVGASVIVVRDGERQVKAHLNVCRHRNARIIDSERGCERSFRCPYHGWLYGLNGELRATPEFSEVEGFDKADFSLHSIGVTVWEGFILINLDPDASPFHERLQGTEVWGLDKYDMANRVTTHQWRYRIPANWKVRAEDDVDDYHLPWVHGETFNAWTPVKGYFDILPEHLGDFPKAAWALLLARFPGYTYTNSGEPHFPVSPDLDDIAPEWQGMPIAQLFPGFTVNPTADILAVFMTYPIGPEESELTVRLCIPAPEAEKYHAGDPDVVAKAQEYADNMEAAFREDDRICRLQQAGLRTLGATRGRYGRREELVHAFDRWLLKKVYYDLDDAPSSP